MKIDAHQHFWKFDPVRDSWITPDMAVIRRDFLPADLQLELQANGIAGCIAVQADQSEMQNDFLLSLATENPFIKGIVGWVDLRAADVEDRLAFYAGQPLLKGFRHVLQGEEDRALMLKPAFTNGLSKLEQFGFTYDILILPDQLSFVPQLASQFPNQPFVIDHLAKPYIKNGEIDQWKKDITEAAACPNVSCKISGIVTEADWQHWQPNHLHPYLDVVWEAFGAKRLIFGSDWPVCLVAGGYGQWVNVLKDYTATLSANEQSLFWGDNAAAFYKVKTTESK